MTKVPVLVTGGAGYIGSHAVLALKDSGWSPSVVDDLSNGSLEVVPEGVPSMRAISRLVQQIFDEQGTDAIMHFAGSIVVPKSVERPLNITPTTLSHPCADQRGSGEGVIRTFSFLNRCSLRCARKSHQRG